MLRPHGGGRLGERAAGPLAPFTTFGSAAHQLDKPGTRRPGPCTMAQKPLGKGKKQTKQTTAKRISEQKQKTKKGAPVLGATLAAAAAAARAAAGGAACSPPTHLCLFRPICG